MQHTGVFITKEELDHLMEEKESKQTKGKLTTAQIYAKELEKKYKPPKDSAINLGTGEYIIL